MRKVRERQTETRPVMYKKDSGRPQGNSQGGKTKNRNPSEEILKGIKNLQGIVIDTNLPLCFLCLGKDPPQRCENTKEGLKTIKFSIWPGWVESAGAIFQGYLFWLKLILTA